MELLVATWTLRLALVGALAVGGLSFSAGAPLVESIDRAAIAAFAFTFLGRQIVGWLETPEQRVLRMRARREKSRGKGSKKEPTVAAAGTGGRKNRRVAPPAAAPAEGSGASATVAGASGKAA
jgi:hypothetical protein